MEESISFLSGLNERFSVKEVDVRAYSPLTLAYIGDAVYELVIRSVVVQRSNRAADALHRKTVNYVKAQTQAVMIEALADVLTEEETAVYKRGRNAKSYSKAKNASMSEYHKATGFEALIGYLYLMRRQDRLLFLVKEGLERIGREL